MHIITLIAVYYAFNLQYEDSRKYLGIAQKRKSYLQKKLENKLLSKMNKTAVSEC